jgi:pyridoxine kinase
MNVISIQSHVSYGHVGNAAAVFALQRRGHEVWPLHTVLFSNHPGHGTYGGEVVDAHVLESCVTGLADLGVLPNCDGILSGYLGTAGAADVIAGCVARTKAANPAAIYCCDPVLGDHGKLYVSHEIASAIVRLVPLADVVTPNLFELAHLTGLPVRTFAEIDVALTALHRMGPSIVLLTSVICAETPSEQVQTLVSTGTTRFIVSTPRLPIVASGAGDLMTAVFFAHMLAVDDPAAALVQAVGTVYGILEASVAQGDREMALIAAQDEIVAPHHKFAVSPFSARA